MLFEVGFSMLIIAMSQPYYAQAQLSEDTNKILDLNEGKKIIEIFFVLTNQVHNIHKIEQMASLRF